MILKGIKASLGSYEGVPRYMSDPEEIKHLQKGEILVCPMTSPEWMEAFHLVGAIVTLTGGKLCHAAIFSREMKIPCVVGIGVDKKPALKQAKRIRVVGDLGVVEILS